MQSLYNILLGNGSNVAVNKFLIKNVGLEAGFLFSTLVDFENYLISQGKIESGSWFYAGRDSLEEQTTLSAHKQKQAEKILLEAGLIEIKLKGVPAKNHYSICSDQVLKIFENWMSKNLTSSSENSSDHIISNNTKENNTKNNTNILLDFFEKNDLKEIVKQTIIPTDNQIWDEPQSKSTLNLIKESMLDYFENKKKLIKKPKLTFKNWILKHKKTDFYKYSNNPVGRQLPDTNQNQTLETFSWSTTNRTFVNHQTRKVFYDPIDFNYDTEKIDKFLEKYKKDNYIISD